MNHSADSLLFHVAIKPAPVNADSDKVLVAAKTDNKTFGEFVFQYFHAPLYLDRFEA